MLLKSVALGMALAFFCAVEPGDWLICPFRRLTGLPCPLCGLTHGLCAVGHGQFRRAFEFHALSPAIFAMFAAGFLLNLSRFFGLLPQSAARSQARIFKALLAALMCYWVWRLVSVTLIR